MKRTISIILCLVMAIGIAVFPQSAPVYAANSTKVDLVTANPGEDCNTQIGISWTAAPDCTQCFIEYKNASDSGWENVTTVQGVYNDTDYQYFLGNAYPTMQKGVYFSEEHKFLNYDVDLKGLKPATRYKYRIGDGQGGYSGTHYFKTSGASEYSFIWISDFHAYTPSGNRLGGAKNAISYGAQLAAHDVDFFFSTGDTVAWGGSYYFWKQVFDSTFVKNYLYIDLNGNHDNMDNTGTKNTFNYFRVTHNNPKNCFLGDSEEPYEPGVVYYFLYNDILWFVFDNETMNASVRSQIQDWAGKVIESMEGKYRYIFLSEHYQWFNGNTGSSNQYSYWSDFCDKYGVDVCFSGNNHIYARTHRIYEGKVVDDDSGVGTYYIQAPNSDCERGTTGTLMVPPTYNSDILAMTYKNTKDPARTHGASVIDVDENGLTLRMFASESGNAMTPEFEVKDSVFISAKRPAIEKPVVDEPADGDVNGDGTADNLDAVLVLKAEANLELPEGCDASRGDVNGDDATDNLDASLILKLDAGL